ncbi:MAG: prolipoprotein diacylglyceryl transferase [Casimicrobiaceae bacterium]
MLIHPQFDPVAIHLGPLAIRWYGLMYLAAFAQVWLLGKYRARKNAFLGWEPSEVEDLLFYGVLGVIIGGRLGEVLLYHPDYYLANLGEIFAVWKGGMSFHGGFIGVLIAMWWRARKTHRQFLAVTDFIAPLVPLGYAFGRIGNFINAELVGRPTDVPWAMVFPSVDNIPRHPSQLYHAGLDGLALFVVLWIYTRKPRPTGATSALFLIGYGLARSFVEFFRTPDFEVNLGPIPITSGQLYSLPMVAVGIWMWLRAQRHAAEGLTGPR